MTRPTEKIRLTHCIGSLRLGGAEKQLVELICRLPRERFEQSLVLVDGGGPLVERVRRAGCEVVELGYMRKFNLLSPTCEWVLFRALFRYLRHLRRSRPHILHAQLFWANILSVLVGRLAGAPVILTSRRQLGHFKSGRPFLRMFENLANRWTSAIFANSATVRRDVLAHERVRPELIEIIYNGVDLEAFGRPDPEPARREFQIQPGERVLIAVANLHPYKGHEDLLRAVSQLLPQHPTLRLLLPGRDQGAQARLKGLIRDLKLEGRAQLIGERKDIPALLTLAEIVIHPSHQEGFSNSILEAMAAGKPLIVTDVGGNPEAVRDGENGLVVPARNPATLAKAVDRLLRDDELRRRMGAASRRRVEEEFSMDHMIERFQEWYIALALAPRRTN